MRVEQGKIGVFSFTRFQVQLLVTIVRQEIPDDGVGWGLGCRLAAARVLYSSSDFLAVRPGSNNPIRMEAGTRVLCEVWWGDAVGGHE